MNQYTTKYCLAHHCITQNCTPYIIYNIKHNNKISELILVGLGIRRSWSNLLYLLAAISPAIACKRGKYESEPARAQAWLVRILLLA